MIIFWFLILLTIIVFVHEMGHYVIARINGVKVDVFSIGFGKELFGWNDKLGTRWKICFIPLGGYVKFFGDANLASSISDKNLTSYSKEDLNKTFVSKSLAQKSAIVFAASSSKIPEFIARKIAELPEAWIAWTTGIFFISPNSNKSRKPL